VAVFSWWNFPQTVFRNTDVLLNSGKPQGKKGFTNAVSILEQLVLHDVASGRGNRACVSVVY
jgi:hypothetical protein